MTEALEPSSLSAKLRRILPYALGGYAVSICTSMAGMEIFSWLTVILVLVAAFFTQHGPKLELLGAPWKVVDLSLLAFLAVIVAGALTVDDQGPGFVTIVGRVRWVLIFFAVRAAFVWIWSEKISHFHRHLLTFMGVVGIYALVQHLAGIDLIRNSNRAVVPMSQGLGGEVVKAWRAAGFYSSPMTFGHTVALAVGFPIAYWLGDRSKTSSRSWLYLLAAALMVLGIVCSFTRGAWLAAAASLLVVCAYAGRKAFVSLLIVGAIGFTTAYHCVPNFKMRIETFADSKYSSNRQRLEIWAANWEMFKDNPIVGVGYGENERLIVTAYQKMGTNGLQGHAHSNLLQVLSGTGILGFLSYAFFSISCMILNLAVLKRLSKTRGWEWSLALGILGAQVAMHIGGLTECNFKDAEVNHHFVVLLALLSALYAREPGREVRTA